MSRVPLVVPFWVLGCLSVAIFLMPESRTPLLVAIGAILIAWGLWLRHLLLRHDRDHNTN